MVQCNRVTSNRMLSHEMRDKNGLSWKFTLVYIRRLFKRTELDAYRLPVVYYDHCFKFAALSFFPFGKEVRYGGGAGSFLLNLIWLIVSGLPLAIESALIGVVLCITVIGIPFGLQQFKLAKLALMPFGSEVY